MRSSVSKLNAKKRRETVEKVIRERGWNEQIVADLAQQTGADRATLYRDKEAIAKLLAQEEAAGLEERRALFLGDLRRLRDAAKTDGSYSPAARLLDLEHRVLGLDRVPLPEVVEDEGPVDTSLETVLREVRRLRRQAQAGHSYVAADRLLEREAALVESIRARDEARAAAEHAHLDEDGLVELVEQAAAGLPDAVKARLRSSLGGA